MHLVLLLDMHMYLLIKHLGRWKSPKS